MKALKLLLLSTAILISIPSVSQQLKHFRLGAGSGVTEKNSGTPSVLYLEPSWQVKRFALGLRLEDALRKSKEFNDLTKINSLTANSQYYFIERAIRLFAGAGAGVYSIERMTGSGAGKTNAFGFYPRLGAEYGRVVITVEYNIICKSPVSEQPYDQAKLSLDSFISESYNKPNYLSIKLGVVIGGGKRIAQ